MTAFWYKFTEAFFDNAKVQGLSITKNPNTFIGRIGETIDYSSGFIIRVVEQFIEDGFQSPEAFLSGINFGAGGWLDGNIYIQDNLNSLLDSNLNDLYDLKNLIIGKDIKPFSTLFPSMSRFNDIKLIISPTTYIATEIKATSDPDGIGNGPLNQLKDDFGSVHIHSLFYELSRGVTQLKDIKNFKFFAGCVPQKGDIDNTLINLMRRMAAANKFLDYGKGSDHKMVGDLTYTFSIIQELNQLFHTILTSSNDRSKIIQDIKSMLANPQFEGELYNIFEDSASNVYSEDKFSLLEGSDYLKNTLTWLENEIDSLIQEDAENLGHYKLVLAEQIDLLFLDEQGTVLKFEDLPQAFTFIRVNGKLTPALLTQELFNQYKNEGKPLLVAHRSSDVNAEYKTLPKFGVIPAEIVNVLPQGFSEGYKHMENDQNKGKVFRNIYLCDANYIRLNSRVNIFKEGSVIEINVRPEGWYANFIKVDANTHQSNYYFAFTVSSGIALGTQTHCLSFLQRAEGNLEPYPHIKKLFPSLTRKSMKKFRDALGYDYIELGADQIYEPIDIIRHKSNLISSMIYQFQRAYSKTVTSQGGQWSQFGITQVILLDSFFNIYEHSEFYYSLKRINQILKLSQIEIDKITPISILSDRLEFSFKYSPKQFYKEFYEKLPVVKSILKQQGFIDDSIYQLLNTWTSSFSDLFEENILDDRITEGDMELILRIDEILIEIFGYSGLTLLKAGLICFNENIESLILSHPRKELTQLLQKTRFTSIGTNIIGVEIGINYFAQTANHLKVFFADFILNGHKQRFKVYDDQTSQYIGIEKIESRPFGISFSQLLYSGAGGRKPGVTSFLNNEYAIFEQLFYKNTMSNLIISGRSTIINKIHELLSEQLNYFLISGRFSSTIDRIASQSSIDKDTATQVVVTLLINYFTNYFMDRIFVPTGHSQYDYLNIIRNMLEKGIDQMEFDLPVFPQSHEFMGQFKLIFDLLQFTQEELLQITVTTLFGFYSTLSTSQTRFRPAWSLLLDSIWPSLKDPVLKTFDFIKNIFDSYPSSSDKRYFSIYFHKFSVSGIHKSSHLADIIGYKYKTDEIEGTYIDIDRQNPQSVLDAITSIVYYLKKYNALCIIKEGRRSQASSDVVAIFDETTLYRPEYIQSFSEDRNKDLVRYSLSDYSEQHYQSWADSYSSISTISNTFPIYRFQDADSFGSKLVSLIRLFRGTNTQIIKLM